MSGPTSVTKPPEGNIIRLGVQADVQGKKLVDLIYFNQVYCLRAARLTDRRARCRRLCRGNAKNGTWRTLRILRSDLNWPLCLWLRRFDSVNGRSCLESHRTSKWTNLVFDEIPGIIRHTQAHSQFLLIAGLLEQLNTSSVVSDRTQNLRLLAEEMKVY